MIAVRNARWPWAGTQENRCLDLVEMAISKDSNIPETELFLLRTVVMESRFPEVKLSHFCLRREHRESPGRLCSLCRAAAGSAL